MRAHSAARGPENEKDVKSECETQRAPTWGGKAWMRRQSWAFAPVLKTPSTQRSVLQWGGQGAQSSGQPTRYAQILQQAAEKQNALQGRHADWGHFQNWERKQVRAYIVAYTDPICIALLLRETRTSMIFQIQPGPHTIHH